MLTCLFIRLFIRKIPFEQGTEESSRDVSYILEVRSGLAMVYNYCNIFGLASYQAFVCCWSSTALFLSFFNVILNSSSTIKRAENENG